MMKPYRQLISVAIFCAILLIDSVRSAPPGREEDRNEDYNEPESLRFAEGEFSQLMELLNEATATYWKRSYELGSFKRDIGQLLGKISFTNFLSPTRKPDTDQLMNKILEKAKDARLENLEIQVDSNLNVQKSNEDLLNISDTQRKTIIALAAKAYAEEIINTAIEKVAESNENKEVKKHARTVSRRLKERCKQIGLGRTRSSVSNSREESGSEYVGLPDTSTGNQRLPPLPKPEEKKSEYLDRKYRRSMGPAISEYEELMYFNSVRAFPRTKETLPRTGRTRGELKELKVEYLVVAPATCLLIDPEFDKRLQREKAFLDVLKQIVGKDGSKLKNQRCRDQLVGTLLSKASQLKQDVEADPACKRDEEVPVDMADFKRYVDNLIKKNEERLRGLIKQLPTFDMLNYEYVSTATENHVALVVEDYTKVQEVRNKTVQRERCQEMMKSIDELVEILKTIPESQTDSRQQ